MSKAISVLVLLSAPLFCPALCSAGPAASGPPAEGAADSSVALPALPPAAAHTRGGVLDRLGVGVRLASTGPGFETAYEVSPRINLRGGFNYFAYTADFDNDGIHYKGNLKFQSGEVHLDYFLWRSLHVSPGIFFSNQNLVSGNLAVPGGQAFTVSNTTYTSNPASPIVGNGALKFNTVAPSILFGIGNLVPRGKHRFSFSFEVGGAFRGTPTAALNFTGSACDQSGLNCQTVTSDPSFQTNVTAQQNKFNNDISFLKFYPIISAGFGFRL